MLIGIVKERLPGETRVAATPTTVGQLTKLGHEVVLERGAGVAASFGDGDYEAAGARVGGLEDVAAADAVVAINPLGADVLGLLRPGTTVVSLMSPHTRTDEIADLVERKLTGLAMDAVPRISRAQSMDVLSSMANVAGYRAVVEAAHAFGRFLAGQVTAAGKVPPAKVLVVGAGVAGLAAIGAAGSLGAVVRATDPRPEVADQVASLGGEYLPVRPEAETSATGYAREMDEDYKQLEAQLYADQCRDVDIVITTALIPGRPAPRIITAEMVASMRPGSVVVDMAAASGGNVEGTVPGEAVVTENGVTLIGYTDLPARLPAQSSQLYGTNVVNLFKLLTPAKDGEVVFDLDDVVVRSITVAHGGELLWPPPPVAVSAQPTTAAAAPAQQVEEPRPASPRRRLAALGAAVAVFAIITALAPPVMQGNLTVFFLAIVVGYYVIGNVHHALHTPLMSVTNAISGIVVVGAFLQVGVLDGGTGVAATILATTAIVLASINIFGGFGITHRMLSMFIRS